MVLWMFLVVSTVVSQVIMLNMMVTIMGESFNELNPIKSQVQTFVMIRMLNEFASLIRYVDQSNENYIYYIESCHEQQEDTTVSDHIQTMKDSLKSQISSNQRKTEENAQILIKDMHDMRKECQTMKDSLKRAFEDNEKKMKRNFKILNKKL